MVFYGCFYSLARTQIKLFLAEMNDLANSIDGPRCVGGDFKTLLGCQDKKGGKRQDRFMRRFKWWVRKFDNDPPLLHAIFTWFSFNSPSKCSRIDSFLFSVEWGDHFQCAVSSTLPRPTSVHCPLLLETKLKRCCSIPFSLWTCG